MTSRHRILAAIRHWLPQGLRSDLTEGPELNSNSFHALEDQWTTKGARELPFGVVVVDETVSADVLRSSSVLYVGGPVENELIAFRTA